MRPVNPNAQFIKARIFSGAPYCIVSQFAQYQTRFEQLPLAERKKLDGAADHIVRSFTDPELTGGFVTGIGLRGHADQDLLKTGKARLDFEQAVSEERARQTAAALMKAIHARVGRLGTSRLPLGDPFEPVIEGMGARKPMYTTPSNERERSMNRRVEIFLLSIDGPRMGAFDFDLPPQKRFDE